MWIVRIALRRPYTFVVLAMLIVLMGVLTIQRMPTDMFPEINIPVVAAIWTYQGLPPAEMEGRITTQFERACTTTVSGIEHMESQTLAGVAVVKIYLQPGTSLDGAVAQVTAVAPAVLRQMPPGATAPLVMPYSASEVSILQLGVSSATLNEQQIYDYATNFLRVGLATVPGAQLPLPLGGKVRQIMVDLDPQKLYAWGIGPGEISSALNLQNLILPSGTAKVGAQEYPIVLNGSPSVITAFNSLPVKKVSNTMVYLGDVAHVRDGFAPQTSAVLTNGSRGALIPVLKASGASTLTVVSQLRAALPQVQATLPPELKVQPLFDQSVFVSGAISGVVREAAIAAGLTGLMMLLFLGSWRSTVIVLVSIPLSLLVSIIVLNFLGQTLNLLTLGGMALAVGILVDDATVAIENVHRQRGLGKPLNQAILDGSAEIAVPALVSTLCICIVFVPVTFIAGAAKSLFVPLAMSVVFAMLTSYFLSRTLVPTMIQYLLRGEKHEGSGGHNPIAWASRHFERGFERLRQLYGRALESVFHHRRLFILVFAAATVGSVALIPLLGRDFFPTVDAGQFKLHIRAPAGTRIEETERLFAAVENRVRQIVPPNELDAIIDNIGVPVSGINLTLGDPSMISSADGEMLVSLTPKHGPTANYIRALRRDLHDQFPNATFFFLPADISTQVLNFGLSAPLDVRFIGPAANQSKNLEVARRLVTNIGQIPGAVDIHLAQVPDTPELAVDVDRSAAQEIGLSMRDVANNLLVSTSGSFQTAPNFWLDPNTGVQYTVAVQTPQFRIDSIPSLQSTPLTNPSNPGTQLLSNVANVSRTLGPTNITHYNVARTLDVQAGVDGADLGAVSSAVQKLVDQARAQLPRGSTIELVGQPQAMNASFTGLGLGIIFAVVLVFLLIAVNFQSWLDPLIILTALPGTIAGIVWGLFLTGTTLSIPALMGALMSIGVASANSILVVTFALERRREGVDLVAAALDAGRTRLRPVMMTAIAMMLGMLPMALGLGDGGEQNAPLGRAVIGGLVFATVSTLFFVPVMFSVLAKSSPVGAEVDDDNSPASQPQGGLLEPHGSTT
jgi:multidrug efflux pump subunit AcrB